jgi:sugar phosphate isomerase/epimerase
MVISFHGSLAGTALHWRDTIRLASNAGFEAVDLDVAKIGPDEAGEIRRCLDAAGLVGGAGPLPVEMREDEDRFLADLALFDWRLEAAATIGIRVLHRSLPASSDRSIDELVPLLHDRWCKMADRAREYEVTLAVEPLGALYRRTARAHEGIWRLEEATAFAQSCGAGVGVLVDSWHWYLAGSSAAEIVEAGSDIVHVHLADVPRRAAEDQRDTERVLPGQGVVDFEPFVSALHGARYDRLVSPEVPGAWTGDAAPEQAVRLGLSATRTMLRAQTFSGGGGGGGGGGGDFLPPNPLPPGRTALRGLPHYAPDRPR